MKTITRLEKEYPIREFMIKFSKEDEPEQITISVESLHCVLDYENNKEDEAMDNKIYFYVDDNLIEKPAQEICENYLDEKLIFVEEL